MSDRSRLPLRVATLLAQAAGLLLLISLISPAWATTFVVNSTVDPGNGVCEGAECTLREAIDAANASPGLDTIAFAIGGGGAQTIILQSALAPMNQSIVIDGSTQPLFSGSPLITIDAVNARTGLCGLVRL